MKSYPFFGAGEKKDNVKVDGEISLISISEFMVRIALKEFPGAHSG